MSTTNGALLGFAMLVCAGMTFAQEMRGPTSCSLLNQGRAVVALPVELAGDVGYRSVAVGAPIVQKEFNGPGRIFISINQVMQRPVVRPTRPAPAPIFGAWGQVSLRVEAVDASTGKSFLPCSGLDVPISVLSSIVIVDVGPGAYKWRMQVTEKDKGNASRDQMLSIYAGTDILRQAAVDVAPICRRLTEDDFSKLTTRRLNTVSLWSPADGLDGEPLYVEGPLDLVMRLRQKAGTSFSIRTLAKPTWTGSFAPACVSEIGANAEATDTFVVASARPHTSLTDGIKAVWRVEVSTLGSVERESAMSLEFFEIVHDFENPTPPQLALPPGGLRRATSELVCSSKNLGSGPLNKESLSSNFAGVPLLRVKIASSQNAISQQERGLIRDALLEAVALWRFVCPACEPTNMVLVEIDGERYVHPGVRRFMEALPQHPELLKPPDGEASLRDPGRPGSYMLDDFLASNLGGRIGIDAASQNYEKLANWGSQKEEVCKLASSRKTSFRLAALSRAIGCEGERAVNSIEFTLLLSATPVGCGSSANVVACEADPWLVELNVRDYQFVDHRTRQTVIGSSGTQVGILPVILHELGHWIGMGHLRGGETIMADTLKNARCLTDYDAWILSRIARSSEPWKAYTGAALRYK
ncbi:MAG: hypothetical protein K2Y35_13345 [Burkholderiales bacterium]|nr:hypothetical protein [Burkholderiales bacterium]